MAPPQQQQVVYEVNLEIDSEIADDYIAWLEEHVKEILALPCGFQAAEIFTREAAENGRLCFTVQYRVQSQASLDVYFRDHAAAMREDGLRRFGTRFSASRRVLTHLRAF